MDWMASTSVTEYKCAMITWPTLWAMKRVTAVAVWALLNLKKWQYACRLIGTSSLEEGAM
jgi:hypothetical protein